MSTREQSGESLAEQVGETGNILLLTPALDAHTVEACTELSLPTNPSADRVVAVTYSESPDDRLARWRERTGTEMPRSITVVSVGETTRASGGTVARSATGAGGTEAASAGAPIGGAISVKAVEHAGDLTGLGITLSQTLEASADANRTVVCFDSLSTLLQYADLQRTFRFLHVLTNRITTVGALAHYHMDPTAHDDQTVNTLMQLFDGVVERGDDGWTVRTR